jgi:hypothetical protein
MNNGTHVTEFLSQLSTTEKDYLAGIAGEALRLMQTPRTPTIDNRIRSIVLILQPMLEAMQQDRETPPEGYQPALQDMHSTEPYYGGNMDTTKSFLKTRRN